MSSNHQTGQRAPWLELDGVRYDLVDSPLPLYSSPQVAFEGGVVLGDPSRRTDRRTVNVVLSDTSEGLGTEEYIESQGLTTFTDATVDTRFGTPVGRPRAVSAGTLPTGVFRRPTFIEAGPGGSATLFAWCYDDGESGAPTPPDSSYYGAARYDGSTWTSLEARYGYTGFARFNGQYVVVRETPTAGSSGLATSTDGVTWTEVAAVTPRTVEGVSVSTTEQFQGACIHDNKLYTFSRRDSAIHYQGDLSNTSTRRVTEKLKLQPLERVVQLVEWRYDDAPTVYVVTTQRILFLDDLTDTFATFLDLTPYTAGIFYCRPRLVPHSDGNAYVFFGDVPALASGFYEVRDTVLQLTGNTVEDIGPNKDGGVPYNKRSALFAAVSGLHWLWVFGTQNTNSMAGIGASRTYALGKNLGWHVMYADESAATYTSIAGGGFVDGKLYTVYGSGNVVVQSYAIDTVARPANLAQAGVAAYDTAAQEIVYGWTDLGIDEPILIRDVEIDARVLRQPGIPVGSALTVHYATNGSPSWNVIASLDGSSAFPRRIPLAGAAGIACEEFRVRLVLTPTVSSSPLIRQVVIHGLPAPDVRSVYSAQIDLRGHDLDTPNGQRRNTLRTRLEALAARKTLVAMSWGYGTWKESIGAVRVSITGRGDPHSGEAIYTVTALDYTTPASGTSY